MILRHRLRKAFHPRPGAPGRGTQDAARLRHHPGDDGMACSSSSARSNLTGLTGHPVRHPRFKAGVSYEPRQNPRASWILASSFRPWAPPSRKLNPRTLAQEPGHVRRGHGLGADHRPVPARPRLRQRKSRLLLPDQPLALVHRALRQLRRSRRRRPRQGAGRLAAQGAHRNPGQAADRHQRQRLPHGARHEPRRSATSSSSKLATSSPRTAKSSKVSPRSTKRPSPANPPLLSVNPAAIARPSQVVRRFFPTGSAYASPLRPARPSSTA